MSRATSFLLAICAVAVCRSLFAEADVPEKEIGVAVSGTVYTSSKAEDVRTVAGASVHLRDLPTEWDVKPPDEPLILAFSKGEITPKFACLQVDQKVVIKAPEGEMFALRAYSRARGEFGVVVPPDRTLFTDSFPKPDNAVLISCAIHPMAKAQLHVVPTPGHALCDSEGRFILPRRLPKGEHVLIAFYPGVGWAEKPITLRGDEESITVEMYLAPKSSLKKSNSQ
jgi:hypothetical protein